MTERDDNKEPPIFYIFVTIGILFLLVLLGLFMAGVVYAWEQVL